MKSTLKLTKKDIVVVLACAFFLLMNLGAVGARGREHAKRILCASRLQKWGKAIFMHSADNGNLMFMVRRWGNPGEPYPHYMGQEKEYDPPHPFGGPGLPGEWNLFEINPYIGAFSETYNPPIDCQATKLIGCPSSDSEFMVDWNIFNCEDEWGFIEPAYSYWVISGMPTPLDIGAECSGYVMQDLTIDTLSPSRLVMSDILANDGNFQGAPYRYNHGKNGWSWVTAYAIGHTRYDPYPDATGRNQLFGDGHIEWRSISPQYDDNLPNTNDVGHLEDQWNGPGSGWMNTWDTSWY
jgi:hypothetical protein